MGGSFKKYWSFYVEGYRYFQLLIATTKQAVVSLFVPKVMFFFMPFYNPNKVCKTESCKIQSIQN